ALREILYENAPCHTASQKELVNSLASERDRRMQELDAEMARLTDALSRLAAEKDRIQEEYRLCRMALASPIRALPSETLCEIFELRVKRTPWGEPPRSIDDFLPPTVRTWYCKIHSVPSSVDSDELLKREEEEEEEEEEEDYHSYNMSQLQGSSAVFPTHRLRVLRLVGYERPISPNLSDLPPDSFPLLEHLCLK
ncbi:hypothetical protein EV714DRAFT_178990, partial [Schizophyllum commune]